jgi:hypothetical protein
MRKRQRKKNGPKMGRILSIKREGNTVFIKRALIAPVRIISCNCKFSFDISNSASDGTGED